VARYLGPKAKLSRREGTDLFLKSARRSIATRPSSTPSPASTAAPRVAHLRLRSATARKAEGQAHVRRAGAQFRRYFAEAERRKGNTGANLLFLLESRWTTSSTAWASAPPAPKRASWCRTRRSRSTARSSTSLRTWSRPATWWRCAKSPRSSCVCRSLAAGRTSRHAGWVEVDATREGVFKKVPDRDQFGADINESLIVELYSR
jgi:small subunit ribosomal protein S4